MNYYGFILLLIGGFMLGANNGINGMEMTPRNIFLTLVGMSCVFVGGFLMGRAL